MEKSTYNAVGRLQLRGEGIKEPVVRIEFSSTMLFEGEHCLQRFIYGVDLLTLDHQGRLKEMHSDFGTVVQRRVHLIGVVYAQLLQILQCLCHSIPSGDATKENGDSERVQHTAMDTKTRQAKANDVTIPLSAWSLPSLTIQTQICFQASSPSVSTKVSMLRSTPLSVRRSSSASSLYIVTTMNTLMGRSFSIVRRR